MPHAYDKAYLEDAKNNLGEMADYAANCCGCDMTVFWQAFISTGYASQFETGFPKIISGLSGTELACYISQDVGLRQAPFPEASTNYAKSPEYWGGGDGYLPISNGIAVVLSRQSCTISVGIPS